MKHSIILIVLFSLLVSGCKSFTNRYTVVVDNVEGLEEGTEVTCAGLVVGKVTALDLFRDSVAVGIEIKKDFKIPVGSKFIVQKGIWGHGQLVIQRSDNPLAAKNRDTLSGYLDSTQFKIVATDTIKAKKMKESVQKIADGIKELIEASRKDSINN